MSQKQKWPLAEFPLLRRLIWRGDAAPKVTLSEGVKCIRIERPQKKICRWQYLLLLPRLIWLGGRASRLASLAARRGMSRS